MYIQMPRVKRLLKTVSVFCFVTIAIVPTSANAGEPLKYDGPHISFDDIYQSPDDQELNFNYARQQARLGDYISSAAALERMLFAQPNWDAVRLQYAIVLFHLDDQQASLHELEILEGRPLSPEQKNLLSLYKDKLSGKISDKNANTQSSDLSGSLAVGVRYDNNAINALNDVLVVPASEGNISGYMYGNLNFSTLAIPETNTRLNASVWGKTRRNEKFSQADYDVFGGKIGVSGGLSKWTWKADLELLKVSLSSEKYLSQIGSKFTLSNQISDKTQLWASIGYYDQKYDNLPTSPFEDERSGDKVTFFTGANIDINPSFSVAISGGYEDKQATNTDLAYSGFQFVINPVKTFNNGVYVNAFARYRQQKYKTNIIPFVSPITRKNDAYSGRIALGVPIPALGELFGGNTRNEDSNMRIEAAFNYYMRSTNLNSPNYKNTGLDLKLVLDF